MNSMSQTPNLANPSIPRSEMIMDAPHRLAIVAHDLRNPLACIVSSLELLDAKSEEAGSEAELIIRRGLRAASRIDDMLRNLLEDMRSQHEARPAKKTESSLRAIVDKAVDGNLLAADRKSIPIAVKGADITLDVNEDLLMEALENLLSNAVKYSPQGSEVICEIIENRNFVTVHVSDHGQGLTADDLRYLGRPFQTLSSTPTGGEQRTGLGLWAVGQIARMLNAEFHASSDGRDLGATFSLHFPKQSKPLQRKSFLPKTVAVGALS